MFLYVLLLVRVWVTVFFWIFWIWLANVKYYGCLLLIVLYYFHTSVNVGIDWAEMWIFYAGAILFNWRNFRFIRPEDIPVQYGGMSRASDMHNGPPKPASEFTVKGGEKVNIQIEGIEVDIISSKFHINIVV